MLEGQLTDLAVDPGAVEGDRPLRRAKRRDDGGDRRVTELDTRDLCEDRRFPGCVGEPGLRSPRLALPDVELAMAAVGKGAVASGSDTAHALEKPTEQVDTW